MKIVSLVSEDAREKYKLVEVEFPKFWEKHILVVVKMVEKLCQFYPEADKEICLLSAYLHDIGRTSEVKEDHAISGLPIIREILEKYNYPENKIGKVLNACRNHSCDETMPETIEGKITASADAMAHLIEDIYFRLIWIWMKDRDFDEAFDKVKMKIKEKVDRDFNKKIFFSEGKEMVREKYGAWVKLLGE